MLQDAAFGTLFDELSDLLHSRFYIFGTKRKTQSYFRRTGLFFKRLPAGKKFLFLSGAEDKQAHSESLCFDRAE